MRKAWLLAFALATTGAAAQTEAPAGGPSLDLAFGAFQRGYYATALKEAMARAEKGTDGPAMTLLGELYSNGLGVALNLDKAREWYLLGAKAGDPQAMVALGMMALQGRGMGRDKAFAERMFRRAAEANAIPALYNLGLMRLDADPQDFTAAAGYFIRCAALGSPDCQYALASLHKVGKGVSRDPVKAVALLQSAARSGLAEAQIDLAIMQFNGDGIDKDESAAADLFTKAADKGNPVAMNRLARILMAGRGRPKDPVEAAKWHLIARTRGADDAWLDQQMAGLPEADRNEAAYRARPWLRGEQTQQP